MKRSLSAAMVVLLVAMSAPFVLAENGRDFSALYTFRDVREEGDSVTFTLLLRVSNHSGADVEDAVVTLLYRMPVRTGLGEFHIVSIPYRRAVVVSESVRVPLREYQQWTKGAQPRFEISYHDAEGRAVIRPIEMAPGLVREGN